MTRAVIVLLCLASLATAADPRRLRVAYEIAGRVTASGPFTPLSISDCVYWFDGADTNTVTVSTNIATAWRSKGSNTNAALPVLTGSIYSNDVVSGNSALWFNGTSHRGYTLPTAVATPAAGGGGAYTFIACYNRAANNIRSVLWGGANNASYGNPGIHVTDNKLYFQMHGKYRGTTNTYTTGRAILAYYSDGSADAADYNLRRNGVAIADLGNAADATSPTVATMGFYSTSGNAYHNGWMFEMIYYARKLSVSEIQQVEAYLTTKWGL